MSTCFNEAEAFTPRIQESKRPICLSENCFNEAEAFTPRIRYSRFVMVADSRCFNEAEAFTPRIQRQQCGPGTALLAASMRPRLLHLGYILSC